jgi:hypothetical protein
MLERTEPEWRALHGALEELHKKILYDLADIEHVGYDQSLFEIAVKVPGNRTLADIIVWILEAGGELQGVQVRGGEFVGPTLSRQQLRARWESLDPGDLGRVHEDEGSAVRVLRGLLGFNDPL